MKYQDANFLKIPVPLYFPFIIHARGGKQPSTLVAANYGYCSSLFIGNNRKNILGNFFHEYITYDYWTEKSDSFIFESL